MKKYILKTTKSDGSTYGGFKWTLEVGAIITAPDFDPTPECGKGLHGWLNGVGCGTIGYCDKHDARWLVLETEDEIIQLNGKVKFKSCSVLHVGDRLSATTFLRSLAPEASGMIGESVEVGNNEICCSGDYGTATAGYKGTASAGNSGTATAGYKGTASAGDYGIINIKYWDENRYRYKIGYIGEDGLLPDVLYKLDDNFNFVKA